jgi:hypothetical protein
LIDLCHLGRLADRLMSGDSALHLQVFVTTFADTLVLLSFPQYSPHEN